MVKLQTFVFVLNLKLDFYISVYGVTYFLHLHKQYVLFMPVQANCICMLAYVSS